MTLRRMSLMGDAMSHAILPGAAVGFLLFGLDIVPMTQGGAIAGVMVALSAGVVSRFTVQKEDAAMAAFYLISLTFGVLIVSLHGSSVDVMHVLFGTVLALGNDALVGNAAQSVNAVGFLACTDCGMFGPALLTVGFALRLNGPFSVFKACRAQSGCWLSGIRLAVIRGCHDITRSNGAFLGSQGADGVCTCR